jgi:predicted O-linked N-acetylglucosamine transferase (SPINDLY family)
LWGDEHHERYDGMMIRRAGLPESLIAKTREEYVAEAVRLVRDDDARNALRDHLLEFDLAGEFFGEPRPEHKDAFLKAMESIYEGQFHDPS